ncbi:unnamed protein product [Moneuplotes crassus]|uniref:F-box domain-containing protein n=2 Tax=Euplotes crassus TaxID=5936 RepID=A0AAD2D374_EUPCR|nr:unnamed protein product [Moneuplotes crassus]
MESNTQSALLSLNIGSLSEVFTFTDLEQSLQLRLVCRKFNQSVCYGWRLRIYELEILKKRCEEQLTNDFDEETLHEHKTMSKHQDCIVHDLRDLFMRAFKLNKSVISCPNFGSRVNPDRLIVLPILASMILMKKDTYKELVRDYSMMGVDVKLWTKIKLIFKGRWKTKALINNFDISEVAPDQIKECKKILRNNSDLSVATIRPYSHCASYMFQWTNLALKYFKIRDTILELGVCQIEQKLATHTNTEQKMVKVFERILANQEF